MGGAGGCHEYIAARKRTATCCPSEPQHGISSTTLVVDHSPFWSTIRLLQHTLSPPAHSVQEAMVGLREVSRQLKLAQGGVKACACAAATSQERGRRVREVAQELSACMKELTQLTGVARGRLGAGAPSSLVHDSGNGEELPLSQEIPLQGHIHQAPPPGVHTHQSRAGLAALQPTPLMSRPPAPKEPHPPSRTASRPPPPALAVVPAPIPAAAPPLSATAGLQGLATTATSTPSSGGGAPVAQGCGAHVTQGRHRDTSPKAGAHPSEEGSRSRSADFAETVPLQELLKEGLLCPGLSCLSTGIMVSCLPPCTPTPPCCSPCTHTCPLLAIHRVSGLWPPSMPMGACSCPPDRSSHNHTSGSTPVGRRLGTGASGPRGARPTRW